MAGTGASQDRGRLEKWRIFRRIVLEPELGFPPTLPRSYAAAHYSSIAIALVSLWRACLNARLHGPSSTSSSTSPPRTAGRSCMKIVPEGFETWAIILLVTL